MMSFQAGTQAVHVMRRLEAVGVQPIEFGSDQLSKLFERKQVEGTEFAATYAERAGHDFTEIGTVDFYRRFSLACGNSWGLAAELMIAVLLIAHDKNINVLSSAMFCEAFTERLELQSGFSPFSVDDYEEIFLAQKMIELWSKSKE